MGIARSGDPRGLRRGGRTATDLGVRASLRRLRWGVHRPRAAMRDRGGRVQARPVGLAGSGNLHGRGGGHASPTEGLALPIH